MTRTLGEGTITMKDAKGHELSVPFDRGDFAIEAPKPRPWPAFDFHAAFDAPGPDLTWGEFSAAVSTLTIARPVVDPVMVIPVRVMGHRGAWVTRTTCPEVSHDGNTIAVRYSCFGGMEWRRKAPARLRRLTAQRRMQAERKARRAGEAKGGRREA